MMESLEQALADTRGDAAILRKRGHAHDAELLESLCDRFARAAEDYLTRLTEEQAMLQSGHSRSWLRSRFSEWEQAGHAGREGRRRWYRAVLIPRRGHADLAYQAGRRAGDNAA